MQQYQHFKFIPFMFHVSGLLGHIGHAEIQASCCAFHATVITAFVLTCTIFLNNQT
jgi:hypothetical protein